ncbi:MAG: DUF1553 domain-containing protein [Verrucomicrobiales bacterium]
MDDLTREPHFTRVIANRLWKRAFGHGVIEPVDDFTELAQPVDADLMAFLEDLMRGLKYNLRAFQEVIYNTQAWQRAAGSAELEPGEPCHFPGPSLRRLTAEQIWDSVVALTIENADQHRPLLRGQLASSNASASCGRVWRAGARRNTSRSWNNWRL